MRYAIVIESAEENYSVYVPDLSGCVATGASLEEAEACIHEAIDFHLDGLRQDGMPIPLSSSHVEYLELVDWAGRAIRADKRGAIPSLIPPILNRLGLDPGPYLHHMGGKSKLTQHITAIGPLVGSRSRRCSRSLAPGAIYRLQPCNRTSGIHAVDRLQALAK